MFNLFRKQNYFHYEVIYRYGSRPFFSRAVIKASSRHKAHRSFDTDPNFEGCTRVCDAIILDSRRLAERG